jgi:hypothetical protein
MLVVGTVLLIICGMFAGASAPWHRIVVPSSVRHEDKSSVISGQFACFLKGLVFSLASHHSLLYHEATSAVELCIAFELFEFADLAYTHWHGTATVDMTVHHLMHICIGVALFADDSNKNARVGVRLLTQETSTAFLDVFLFARHRHSTMANVSFLCFFLAFFLYRVVGTGILCYELWTTYQFFVVFPAYMLQLWWFRIIVSKLQQRARTYFLSAP